MTSAGEPSFLISLSRDGPGPWQVKKRTHRLRHPTRIGNAPAAYPADGQYVPLVACPFFSFCNAPVRFFSAPQDDYIMINAQPGHFDAAGSSLRWRFYTVSF
jgi:hypothetical protein